MGNFDKVVILLVLFLVAIVLGVSLTGSGEEDDPLALIGGGAAEENLAGGAADGTPRAANGPLESLRDLRRVEAPGAAGAPPTPEPQDLERLAGGAPRELGAGVAAAEASGAKAGDAPLLTVELGTHGAELGTHSAAPPTADERAETAAEPGDALASSESSSLVRILISEQGLAPTQSGNYRRYTWREDDTFSSVATRFYGLAALASLLRTQNEGRDPQAGEPILVPVYDLRSEAGSREPARVVPRGWSPRDDASRVATNSAEGGGGSRVERPTATADGPEEEENPSPPAASGASTYVVKPGETLSHVSLAVYGSAQHWKRIYDANTDVLRDENTVSAGQRLRIPPLASESLPIRKGRVQ